MNCGRDSNIIAFPRQDGTPGEFVIRVELLLMPQPVWRRLAVPGNMDFWQLHVALQDALGWDDCHLHLFSLDDPRTGHRLRFGIPDQSAFHGAHTILPGWQHAIAPYFAVHGRPVLYTYDFGDDWQHEVILEEVRRPEDGQGLPRCLAGAGVCPPEDSGGPTMCAALMGTGQRAAFDPQAVTFDDPQRRWRLMFGRD